MEPCCSSDSNSRVFERFALPSSTDLLDIHARQPERWPFLLASSTPAGRLGQWSLLLRADDDPPLMADRAGTRARNFLQQLGGRLVRPGDIRWSDSEPPFVGGWFVYLGYELAGAIESRLHLPAARDRLPIAYARRCRAAIALDHRDASCWLVAEDEDALRAARADLCPGDGGAKADDLPADLRVDVEPDQRFVDGVRRIQRYILDGDVFQVNLSRRWQVEADQPLSPVAMYRALAQSNPAPFAALARLPGGTIVSSSPERLVSVRGRRVETRPIAGTRPRGACQASDQSLSDELVAHPKERAEHIMLIDLERNDLGRVCETGSITVDDLMIVESYAHVHHIVSNVCGRLRGDATAADVIAAVFPGGTITGCPKVRCMEIIAELEGRGRSFYTGALGYLGGDGRLDLNILIRSVLIEGSAMQFSTGAGIVADSNPDAELAETVAKARGLLAAIGHA